MAENKRESVGNLNVKVDVDVSEAIKGLKAVQREVKETVRSLAELRSQDDGSGKYNEYIKRIEDVVGERTGERALTNDIIYRAYETRYAGPLLFTRCAGVTTSLRALAETFDDVVYLEGLDEKPSENELNGKIVFKEPGVRLPGFPSPLRLITIETVDMDKGSLIVIDGVAITSAKVLR